MRRLILTSVLLPLAFMLASATLALSQPVFTIENKKDACNNLANGSFDILVTSATGPIEAFVFSGGAPIGPIALTLNVPQTVSGLLGTVPGRPYLIVVSDDVSSEIELTTIFLLPDVSASLVSKSNASSCLTANGSIDIDVTGGSGAYTYSWTSTNLFTATTQDIAGLAAGDYTVVISDEGTICTQTFGPITITEPPPPTDAVLAISGSNPICFGQSTTLNVTITGGVSPYTVVIAGIGSVSNYISGSNIIISPAADTNYTLTSVTDANGCFATAVSGSADIIVNPLPAAPVVSFTPNTYCAGDIITPPVITPTAGSTYTWYSDPGLTNVLITGASPTAIQLGFSTASANATTVFVTETNSNNCTGPSTSVTLTVNANPLAPVVTFSPNTYCVGDVIIPPVITTPAVGSTYTWYSDAGLTMILTTGTAPTNIQLGYNSVTDNITSVFVTETNSNNCTGPSTTVTLTVNAPPLAPVVTFTPSTYCVGDVITPPVITPTAGSTYTWYSDAGLTTILTTGATPANNQLGFSSASANTTTVYVTETNSNNCTSLSTPVTLTVDAIPAAPVVTFTPSTYCAGDVITPPVIATPTVGSTYTWYSDAGLTTILTTGTTPSDVQLGFTTASANTTTVFVTETNSGNCTGPSTPVTLTVNAIPLVPIVTFSPNTYCVGDVITPPVIATPTGGSTYTWYSDAGLTTTLTTGTTPSNVQLGFNSASANTTIVYVTETSSINCTGPATTVTLTVNEIPLAPVVAFTPSAYCVGDVITPPVITTPVGGSTYTWYSDAGLTTILTTGTIPTDVQLGFSTASANITTVFVTETNVSNCTGPSTPVTLTVNPIPLAPVVAFTPSSYCVGDIITPPLVTAPTAGSTYTWYSDAGLTTILITGTNPTNNQLGFSSVSVNTTTVYVTETSSGNCTGPSTPVTLTVNEIPLAPIVAFAPDTYCEGDAITPPVITAPIAGSTYTWYSDAGLTTILITGTNPTNNQLGFSTASANVTIVYVTETSSANCTGPATSVTLTVNAIPLAPVVAFSPNTYCVGDAIATAPVIGTPNAGSTYSWYSDAGLTTLITTGTSPTNAQLSFTSVSANVTTVYVTETNSNVCTGPPTPVTLTVFELPTASVVGSTAICNGDSADLIFNFTGTGPWDFQYSDGVSTISANSPDPSIAISVSPTTTTSYTLVSVSDANCTGTIIGSPVTINVDNLPSAGLTISSTLDPICIDGISTIQIAASEVGVTYQLRNNSDDSNIGTPEVGTGATLDLTTGSLNTTTTFNILATRGACSIELSSTITVTVLGNVDASLNVTPQDIAICEGVSSLIQIEDSEVGVDYQLRNDLNDAAIGSLVAGTGGTINLPTGILNTTTTFNILASNGVCSIELTNLASITVDINPDPSLAVAAVITPLCIGGNTSITVANSEVGVSYQLRDNNDNTPIGSAVSGTGSTIELPTGLLNQSTTFNVLATGGVCVPVQLSAIVTVTVTGSVDLSLAVAVDTSPICTGSDTNIQILNSETGVDYQLINDSDNSVVGGAVSGNGGLINLSTGILTASTIFRVFVTNGLCSAELASTASVIVSDLPSTGLTVTPQSGSVCAGSSTFIEIENSEPGVIYQLRDDADDSIVSGAVIGNGNTISLPTGIVTAAKTFNVLAVNGACSAELTSTPSVSIDAAPSPLVSAVAESNLVCIGTGTFIQVLNSEPGIVYQLRDNADNSNVSGATFGNGGTINLPTGPLTSDRTFNVLASNTLCSVQLLDIVTVTLRATNDPLCSNCSTVVISTINPVKVTCGATVPDGSITFQVEPPVPVVDIIGVKIQIDGPTSKTQTNDFVFTGLAAGDYTYTVTYGDENNPDCIKTGTFTIELSREPDPITFDLTVDEYDCLVNEGSITLENITGAPDTDFDYTVLSSGASIAQGIISNSSAGSFTIPDLLIGDYQIQLNQNQEPVNGCIGIVNSALIDFSIAEPLGGCPVIIPNIFTPNSDGSNDFFEIRNLPPNSSLSITNRWGKEVFSSSDYQNDWTAENISDGVYYYRLVAEGEAITGWVEILR